MFITLHTHPQTIQCGMHIMGHIHKLHSACMYKTYLFNVSRRRQREGSAADNKAESWQVVDLAAVHHVLETTKRHCLRMIETQTKTNWPNLYIV